MNIGHVRELNIEYLRGVWRSGSLQVLIRPENIILLGYKEPIEEQTNIEYLEVGNFVSISENLIVKQIFNDGDICISIKGDEYIFRKLR